MKTNDESIIPEVSSPHFAHGRSALAAVLLALTVASPALQAGIPEPDQIWYGKVVTAAGGLPARLTSGTLTWQIEPLTGDPAWTLSTTLTNLNDQFSFILRVPCETPEVGVPATPGTIQLTGAPTRYRRVTVTLNGQPLTLSSAGEFTSGPANRGRTERLDLALGTLPPDADGDGLSDAWELQHFGAAGANLNDDPDGDGMSNLREYLAGTDPKDAHSMLEVIEVSASPTGFRLRWSSQTDRKYRVKRSASLLTAPAAYQVIQTGILATPPFNEFVDTSTAGAPQYFYLIQLED